MVKNFSSTEEMSTWLNNDAEDRYSPYDIQWVCFDTLTIGYLRVD